MSQSSIPSHTTGSPSRGGAVPFYRKLPRTHLYWLGLTLLAVLALLTLFFFDVWNKEGTKAFRMLASLPGHFFGFIFLWVMGFVGTVGLVLGGSHDAHERGGSCVVSGFGGCLGAILAFALIPTGDNELMLIHAFYVMLGCCTGLELAALREEPPTPATPVVPLALVGLLGGLVARDAQGLLIGVVVLLLQQWLFALLRGRMKDRAESSVPLPRGEF